MEIEKKKGWLGKLFGSRKSSCCSIRIEEVTDDSKIENEEEKNQQSSCCCESCETADNKKD